jgi:hypothetical protein
VFNALLRDYGLRRMFLHSSSMGFTRPGTHEPMLASAPLPEELREVLDRLTRGKARAPEDAKGRALKPHTQTALPPARQRSAEPRVRAETPLPLRREKSAAGRARGGEPAPPRTGGRRAERMRKSGKR